MRQGRSVLVRVGRSTALLAMTLCWLCAARAPAQADPPMVWPVDGTLDSYAVTRDYSEWTWRPNDKVYRYHGGIDIAPLNPDDAHDAIAPAEGDVEFAGFNAGLGNYIIIEHAIDGKVLYSLYSHLDALYVGQGQHVLQRQPLGLLGSTGDSTGIHLHFAIKDSMAFKGYVDDIPDGYGFSDPRRYTLADPEDRSLWPVVVEVQFNGTRIRSGPGTAGDPTWDVYPELTSANTARRFVAYRQSGNGENYWYKIDLPNAAGAVSGWAARRFNGVDYLTEVSGAEYRKVQGAPNGAPVFRESVGSSPVETRNGVADIKVWDGQRYAVTGPLNGRYQIDLPVSASDPIGWVDAQHLVPESGRDAFAGGAGSFVEPDPDPGDCDEWTPATLPETLSGHAMAYDAERHQVILFGGNHGGSTRGETWAWDGSVWTGVATDGPSPRWGHAMVYDAARQRVVLFGGGGNADTWEWNGAAWTLAATDGPPVLGGHAMAYDASRQRVVLFGGSAGFGHNTDTWAWDGSAWALVATDGPSARTDHAMAYDPVHQRVVLFGGFYGNSCLGDTWEWDGAAWTLVATDGPSPRADHAMAYVATGRGVVLFGGFERDGCFYVSGETWEWDGSAWTLVATDGPAPRADHAMAYDTARLRVVLFGGGNCGSVPQPDDTWEWDGAAWTPVATDGPSARDGHAMAYDAARQRVVLFGGYGGGYRSDTWEWDGTAWTLVATDGPSARDGHAMAYDAARQRIVLFGGYGGGYRGDTWEWDGSAWKLVASDGPSPRRGHAMAYDAAGQRVLLFGGSNYPLDYGETWEWDGSVWTLAATDGPSPRDDHAMAYDAARERVVLLGGSGDPDTWEWDGSAWAVVATRGPSVRYSHAMAYDGARQRIVLFGGLAFEDPFYFENGETWEWDGSAWTLLATDGPSPRDDHSMAFDAARLQVVLFSGGAHSSILHGDTWELGCPDRSRSDWNRDGFVDGRDVAAFLADWGADEPDFNDDEVTDSQDVIEFLQEWSLVR